MGCEVPPFSQVPGKGEGKYFYKYTTVEGKRLKMVANGLRFPFAVTPSILSSELSFPVGEWLALVRNHRAAAPSVV